MRGRQTMEREKVGYVYERERERGEEKQWGERKIYLCKGDEIKDRVIRGEKEKFMSMRKRR